MSTTAPRMRSHDLYRTSITVNRSVVVELDALVQAGRFINRSVAIEHAILMLLAAYRVMPAGKESADVA